MSHPINDQFNEAYQEAQEELLEETNASNQRERALELLNIALKCLDRGFLSFTHYVTICQKNNVRIF